MITASLTELIAKNGYGVTGVSHSERGGKIIEARPIALLVLAARAEAHEIALVRLARARGVPSLLVAVSSGEPDHLVVDGQPVLRVPNGTLMATIHATLGGPIDAGPIDPTPRAA